MRPRVPWWLEWDYIADGLATVLSFVAFLVFVVLTGAVSGAVTVTVMDWLR